MDKTQYGDWIVLGVGSKTKYGAIRLTCQCKCGRIKEIAKSELTAGRTTKCKECCKALIDVGSKLGCYTVLEQVPGCKQLSYKCRCNCGVETVVSGIRLRKFNPSYCKKCRGLRNAPVGIS